MAEFLILTGEAEAEFVEKRSRFIGHVWPVDTEEAARAHIDETKKRYHDARHNCWCYLLRDGTIRYSDDGEPQGTAGQPMLEVFQREGLTDLCCVVTRYFGGILLGTGGLARAYTKGAKDALMAAGISVQRVWTRIAVPCPYNLFDRLRAETESFGGVVEATDYGAQVLLTVLLPEERAGDFQTRLTELSAGTVTGRVDGSALRAVPVTARG
jgi:uncharacterized YigZ family protein